MPSDKNQYRKYIRILWITLVSPILLFILFVSAVAMEFLGELPSITDLQNPKSNLASVIYTTDGKELGKYFAENRVNVKYKNLNPTVVKALIATEDVRFYDHSGVDARGLGRVLIKTIIGGDMGSGGGSTLSQQLAKLLFPRERNMSMPKKVLKKIKEWIIAAKLERQYTKEEIITLYLNKFDFIHNAVGIKSAAQIYFGTIPDSLNYVQGAMLVGMLQNPSLHDPVKRPKNAMHRRNVVLSQMMKYDFITRQKFDSLKVIPVKLRYRPEDHNEGLATYFREYLRDEFLRKWVNENPKPDGTRWDIYRDGLKIYTTIDSRLQKYAEEAVKEHMSELQAKFFKEMKSKKNAPFDWRVTKDEIKTIMRQAVKRSERYRSLKESGASEAAIEKNFNTPVNMTVFSWKGEFDTTMTPMDSIRYYKMFLHSGLMSMDPHSGRIKAWVGGINYRHFKYDHVKVGRRQVGSTFKPFVYALAIQEGWSPCKRILNVRTCIDMPEGQEPWCPETSDPNNKLGQQGKNITIKKALANSENFITAYIMKQFGPKPVVDLVRRMGITAPIDVVPAICLGTPEISPYEMVGANCTFANKGTWVEPIFVTRIEDKNGKVLEEFVPRTEEVMSEEKAYVCLQLMKGVVQYGSGVRLRYRFKLMQPMAGKTGTTQNYSDGWFMGITPDLVTGCWTGCEDRSVHFSGMKDGEGANVALPVFAKYMHKVYADKTIKISQGDFAAPKKKIEIEMDCDKYDKEEGEENLDFNLDDLDP